MMSNVILRMILWDTYILTTNPSFHLPHIERLKFALVLS